MSYGSRHFGGNEVDWNREQDRHDQDAIDEAVLDRDEWEPDTLSSLSPEEWDDLTDKWKAEYSAAESTEPTLGSGTEQPSDGGE